MSQRWIVTALGKDRPGIVAGVTQVLYRLGCNLEDSAMTRLEDEFAIMLIFSSPSKATEGALRKALKSLLDRHPQLPEPPDARTLSGREKPGPQKPST